MNHPESGLEGVVVADTALSEVDGQRGRLVLAGYPVEELAESAHFEDVAALLWRGGVPSAGERDDLGRRLGAARQHAFERLDPRLLDRHDGMDALRATVAAAHIDVDPARGEDAAVALTGVVAVNVAAWMRLSRDRTPIAPDPQRRHAADVLAMAGLDDRSRMEERQSDGGGSKIATVDAASNEDRVRALETYLVTVADHGMNASTFAARVVASTDSDLVSAITAAVGALKGPLHGGAPGPVLDMLDAVEQPERASAWISAELAAGRRIMGMGHRVYRVRDPRALVLEHALRRLERSPEMERRLALARAIEREAEALLAAKHPERALKANVEFYTAVLLDALGVDRAAFTPLFAVGRVVGWCAHVAEQQRSGRLIRPSSRYVGPMRAPEAEAPIPSA